MVLDLKKFILSGRQEQEGSFSADLSKESFPAGFSPSGPLRAVYHLQRQGDGVWLGLQLHCDAVIRCDRCLAQKTQAYDLDAGYELAEADWAGPDPELPVTPFGRLDLTELCYQELLLSLPSRFLCSPDCEGLCPVCGRPVSAGCGCRQNVGDDRLSILKQLLS